jgi:hypothetical protein
VNIVQKKLNFSASSSTAPATRIEPNMANIDASLEFSDSLAVQFMLRHVSGSNCFQRNPILNYKIGDSLTRFSVNDCEFFEDDFGDRFGRVYNRSVQQLLKAFPELDQYNRSFFIALGIGANVDPYMLQHVLRSHEQTVACGSKVDYNVLRKYWPPALDAVRIIVLDNSKWFLLQNSSTGEKRAVILRYNKERYTLLNPCDDRTASSVLMSVLSRQDTPLQCPEMSTWDTFSDAKCYLTAELQGREPSPEEYDNMWNAAIKSAGLTYEATSQKWIDRPKGVSHKSSDTDGSMHTKSWTLLQTKLLGALEADTASAHEPGVSRFAVVSPPRRRTDSSGQPSGPITFMDAGSESGKGMYRMMSDKCITHVAGVEIQGPWFHASCQIFAHLRQAFKTRGFRMPAVSILHSCMCANIPELKYLYSITALLWMNNYVFHKIQAFAIQSTNQNLPQPLVPDCIDLTTNAAFQFSQNFQSFSYAAVHEKAGFNEMWNYFAFKPFEVQVTWGNKPCEVTIIRHIEHLKITEHGELVGKRKKVPKYHYSIPAPTLREMQSWDDSMTQWSNLLPTLYSAKSDEIRARHMKPLDAKHNLAWPLLVSLTDLTCLPMDLMSAYTRLMNIAFQEILFGNFSLSVGRRIFRTKKFVGCWYVPNCHWLAVKVDLENNYVAIADSLHQTFQSEHANVHRKVDELANAAGHKQILKRYTINVPDQGNATDCGVLTCLFMLHMAQNDITPNTRLEYNSKPTAQFMRKRIFADIAANKITKFVVSE